MNKNKKPKLRFAEFSGEWQETPLSEGLKIPKKEKPKSVDRNKILTVKLHLNGILKNENTDALSLGANYFIRKKGQFIYGKQNLFNGAFGIIPEELDGFLSSSDVPSFDIDASKIDPKFLIAFLGRENFYKSLEIIATGTGSKRIHEEVLLNLKILLPPTIEEQQKIADCLTSLDELIEAQEEKLRLLKEHKKGLLQQFFPQVADNENIVGGGKLLIINKLPKLRFPEFSGEWQEKTLGEVAIFFRGLTYNSNDIGNKDNLLVLRSSNIQNDKLILDEDLVFVKKECPEEIKLNKGDIVICMSNGSKSLVGKNAEYKGNYDNPITVGAFCSIMRPKNSFIKYILQTDNYKSFISFSIGGGNINNLKNYDLENFISFLPPTPEEQQKIADCLTSLDEVIETQNQNIENLKTHKKGLLQQLFPSVV